MIGLLIIVVSGSKVWKITLGMSRWCHNYLGLGLRLTFFDRELFYIREVFGLRDTGNEVWMKVFLELDPKLGISLPLLLWFLSVCCDSLNVVEVHSFLEYQLRQGCCFLLLFFIQRTNIDKPVFLFSKAFISSCCPISHYHSLHVTCTPTQTHLPCNRELALSIKG